MKDRNLLIHMVNEELQRAYAKHGSEQWSRHEFYGVIREEFDELWDDIKNDRPSDVLEKELVQIIAMAIRFWETGNKNKDSGQI